MKNLVREDSGRFKSVPVLLGSVCRSCRLSHVFLDTCIGTDEFKFTNTSSKYVNWNSNIKVWLKLLIRFDKLAMILVFHLRSPRWLGTGVG